MRRILRQDKRNPAQELDLPISKNPGLNRLAELACGHAIDSADHGLVPLAFLHGFGYYLARMPFEIVLLPQVASDWRRLSAYERAKVRDAIEAHLRHLPTKTSKSRIKRLRELTHPQYRLRVGDLRVFYDVKGEEVQVLAIVAKVDAVEWLEQVGQGDEDSSALGSEG